MSEQRGPSFGVVFGTVWKVFCSILLIPFLILLVYIAIKVIPAEVVMGAVFVAIAGVWIWLTKRMRG